MNKALQLDTNILIIKLRDSFKDGRVISDADGLLLSKLIRDNLSGNKKIVLDFSEIDCATCTVVNNSLGKLVLELCIKRVNELITIYNVNKGSLDVIKDSINLAGRLYNLERGYKNGA